MLFLICEKQQSLIQTLKVLLIHTLLKKAKILLMLFLYMVHFGHHGNVNLEVNVIFVLSTVRSDMDYLDLEKIDYNHLCYR